MISFHLSCESAVTRIISPEKNETRAGVGTLSGLLSSANGTQEQGLQPSVAIPSPSPDLRAPSSSAGTRPDSRQLGEHEDRGGSTGEGGDGGLTSQGVIGTAGSGTSHYQCVSRP